MDIKALRESYGLSQMEFATKVGVAVRTVQNWEYGGGIPASRRQLIEELFVHPTAEPTDTTTTSEPVQPAAAPAPAPTAVSPQAPMLERILDEMVGMRKVVENQLAQKDNQIDRLLGLLEDKKA